MIAVVSAALLAGVIVFGSQVVGNDSTSSTGATGGSSSSGHVAPDRTGRSGKIAHPSFAAEVDADPSGRLAWRQSRIDDVPAGEVLLAIRNDSSVPHNIAIADPTGKIMGSPSTTVVGATASVKVRLRPGTYHYFCAVPGHREGGMDGTLEVVAIGK